MNTEFVWIAWYKGLLEVPDDLMILKIADEIVKHNHLLGKFSRTEAMGLTGDNLSNATLLPSFDLVLGPEAASWCRNMGPILSKITISIHDHLLKM